MEQVFTARVGPFTPGETDTVVLDCSGVLAGEDDTIAASPAPTVTPPDGAGITINAVAISTEVIAGADGTPIGQGRALLINVTLSAGATQQPDACTVWFCRASDGAPKPRWLVVPVKWF